MGAAFGTVALLGAVALGRTGIALLPDVAPPRVVVRTVAPGASAIDVERRVTGPIEEALAGFADLDRIESVSRAGLSLVTLEYPWGTDTELARLRVRERLDEAVPTLPSGAERPAVLLVDPADAPVLIASVTARPGPAGPAADPEIGLAGLEALARTVFRRRLEQVDGIARVDVVGGTAREVRVEADPVRLETHGLSVEDVATAIEGANGSVPAGTVRRGGSLLALRALGEYRSAEEIGGTVVARVPDGGVIRVRDVAAVRDASTGRVSAALFDGRPSIGLLVRRERSANAVLAAERAAAVLDRLEAEHPAVSLTVVTSQATFVAAAIRGASAALLLGAALAFLVLLPFLRDPRWPVAVAISMPASTLGAIAVLHAVGVSLNVASLGGLALGVGMLVDNAIVVVESAFVHRERGLAPRAAAVRGAEEVQGAIVASTATTVAVFAPLPFVDGPAGALLGDLAWAVAASLGVSLATALTLVPSITARIGPRPGRHPPGGARGPLVRGYGRALAAALRRPRAVLGAATALGAIGLATGALLPRTLLPAVDERAFAVRLALPPGTPLERTEALAREVDRRLRATPGVATVLARVGRAAAAELDVAEGRGVHEAILDVRLAPDGPPAERIAAGLVASFAGSAPGALSVEPATATELAAVLGTDAADLVVRLRGRELDSLRVASERIATRLTALPGLSGVRAPPASGQPEVRLSLDRDAIARHGLDVRRVALAIDDVVRGRTATALAEVDRETPIVVVGARPGRPERASALPARDDERRLASVDDLLAVRVDGVPLRLLVRARDALGPVAIRRVDRERTAEVTADVVGRGVAGAIAAVEEAIVGVPLPAGVEADVGDGRGELRRGLRSVGSAFLLALALVWLLLGIRFESLVRPFLVLLVVPLALAGAALALAVTGRGLDAIGAVGAVVLVGIAVNDAILAVEAIDRRMDDGLGVRAAVLDGSRARLRPIVMTTATTVLGLVPLAAGLGAGAELRAPLAIAVVGGLAASTAAALFVVPVVFGRLAGRRATADGPTSAGPGP